MKAGKKLWILAGIAFSFVTLVVIIAVLSYHQIVSPQQAGLSVVALFGMYVGFGILGLTYSLINRLK